MITLIPAAKRLPGSTLLPFYVLSSTGGPSDRRGRRSGPYTFSILTEISGAIHFKDLIDGLTVQEQVDEVTGMSQVVVVDSPDEKRQPTIIVRPEGATGSRGGIAG
jgi:hypothetical protein